MSAKPPPSAASREDRFRTLYEAAYADLLRFVSRRVHPTHAEDVVADAFLVAWRRLDDVPAELGDARAWLFGVARNSLLNDLRGEQRRQALAVRIAEALPLGSQHAGLDPDLVARRLDLAVAWPRLTAVDQEAIALSAWDGLTSGEAATVLGISPVAYRLRLSRARRALRAHLHMLPAATTAAAALTEGNPS